MKSDGRSSREVDSEASKSDGSRKGFIPRERLSNAQPEKVHYQELSSGNMVKNERDPIDVKVKDEAMAIKKPQLTAPENESPKKLKDNNSAQLADIGSSSSVDGQIKVVNSPGRAQESVPVSRSIADFPLDLTDDDDSEEEGMTRSNVSHTGNLQVNYRFIAAGYESSMRGELKSFDAPVRIIKPQVTDGTDEDVDYSAIPSHPNHNDKFINPQADSKDSQNGPSLPIDPNDITAQIAKLSQTSSMRGVDSSKVSSNRSSAGSTSVDSNDSGNESSQMSKSPRRSFGRGAMFKKFAN